MSTRWNLDIKFPPPFSNMFEFLSVFSFDFLSLDCFSTYEEDRFYMVVYYWSFIPMLIAFFLFWSYYFRRFLLSKYPYFESNTHKIYNQHAWCVLLLTYVVLPATSMRQLQSFDCVDINNQSYLRNDTSVNCNSERYYQFRSIIVVLFCFYQFIPVVWMALLYQIRYYLRPSREFNDEEEEDVFIEFRDNNEKLAPLKFLFKDYKCNKWWFEVSDMYRRIIFVGVLPLVSSVAATRASFGCILSIISLVYFREEAPYRFESTNALAYVAQVDYTMFLHIYICA
jgi:hypothetical protein